MTSNNLNKLVYSFSAGFLSAIVLISFSLSFWRRDENKLKYSGNLSRKRVVVFGDSITQHGFNPSNNGWVNSLNNWWTRRVDIFNRGFSGYNSQWGLMVLNKVVTPLNPDIVFVFFGANDAIDPSVKQYIPLEQFTHNIRLIILELKSKLNGVKVIVITPPPVWEEKLMVSNSAKGKPLALDRTNQRTLTYVNACKDVGRENNVPVVDLWSACEGDTDNRSLYLIDGLHLNSRGNDRLFEAVTDLIRTYLPEILPEQLPMQLPEWSQIEGNGP